MDPINKGVRDSCPVTNGIACGCKGVRFCDLCQFSVRVRQLRASSPVLYSDKIAHVYCVRCSKCHRLTDSREYSTSELFSLIECGEHCFSASAIPEFSCLTVLENFISAEEEASLVDAMDGKIEWKLSQSGRRKQEWGPKVNFKAHKVRLNGFDGMPLFSRELVDRMALNPHLKGYLPLEVCNLEYEPVRGSCIDFHQDDTWIWGERLISINLLSGSILTLLHENDGLLVYVPMPRRSLVCMAGNIRYQWKHAILRHHITERRIALTMREADKKFLPDGDLYDSIGHSMIDLAKQDVILDVRLRC